MIVVEDIDNSQDMISTWRLIDYLLELEENDSVELILKGKNFVKVKTYVESVPDENNHYLVFNTNKERNILYIPESWYNNKAEEYETISDMNRPKIMYNNAILQIYDIIVN